MSNSHKMRVDNLLEMIRTGRLKSQQAKVLAFMVERYPQPAHQYHVAGGTGLPEKTAAGRLAELRNFGALKWVGEYLVNGSKNGIYKYVPDPEERRRLRMERHGQKYKLWKKRGETEFSDFVQEIVERPTPGQQTLF